MATEKLIPLSEVKKKLTAVRQYFSGYPSTDQDKLARSVVKLCMEEVDKLKPVDAVEVVRCDECFANGCCSVQIDLDMGDQGYCSKGRRKDNGKG